MRNLMSAFAILVFGLVLAMLVATSKPLPEKNPEAIPAPVTVQALAAAPQTLAVSVQSHGILSASHEIDLLAELEGKVTQVDENFIRGGSFSAHQTLLKMDALDYKVALANAKAELAKAKELSAGERARSEQAKKQWRDLGSVDANALFLRKPQLAAAEASETAAKEKLKHAQQQLEKTQVQLSFPVKILETYAHQGQYLSRGSKVARLYASAKMQVNLPLSQAQLTTLNMQWPLQQGQPLPTVTIHAQLGNTLHNWSGQVRHSSANIDSNNQLAELIVSLDKQAQALPGLYVSATVTGTPQANVLEVPEDAFHDKRFVLVANKDNKIEFRAARFLARQEHSILIKAPIETGETIITSRLPLATEGMLVKPVFNNKKQAPSL